MKGILLRAIQQQCRVVDAQIKLVMSAQKSAKSEAEAIKVELRVQKRQLETSQNEKMRLYEQYISQQISKEDYVEQKASLTSKEQSAKIQIALLEDRLKPLETPTVGKIKLVEERNRVSKYLTITALSEDLMKELVKKVVVFPDGAINIVWNFSDITEDAKVTSVI